MSRRVFMLEADTKHDVTRATRYGEIVSLFSRGEKQPSIWSQHFQDEILSRLRASNFNEYADYILGAGQQVPVLLMTSYVVATYENVNLLLFDSSNEEYVLKAIT